MGWWIVLAPAWPGGIWAIVAGVRWWVAPARRGELVSRYRLRTVTWLIVTPPLLALVALMLVAAQFGGISVSPYVMAVACIAVLVAAPRVVSSGSIPAAWVMVVVACGATLVTVGPSLLSAISHLDWLLDVLRTSAFGVPTLVGGIVNAFFALGKARAAQDVRTDAGPAAGTGPSDEIPAPLS
ncbi:hypothetical protein [Demequina capsici]|uniref:Uncharacterized protein n=1 Tax=Demequina capsici TaxID=3075620 RepID=A0AA96F696_9MICO|nr:hypothetical protein [Demequina sp. OYTSA14]WNM24474.1 hypothetical protein RN606_14080 [Demequina sp. OYTSA14]